ncbi:MAG: DUF423 domain-containing protein [Chitinophagales bacterium]|nr:DUF423 domain-containing protein [Bacteroidota bacterium]
MIYSKFFLVAAGFLGALAVILGAFGAHALRAHLSADQIRIYETGVHYQFFHVLALLAVGISMQFLTNENTALFRWAGILFIIGILFFSGSLYLLASCDMLSIQSLTPILGPITPLGGLSFIAGWVCFALAWWQQKG